jgi:hypothetical protein
MREDASTRAAATPTASADRIQARIATQLETPQNLGGDL